MNERYPNFFIIGAPNAGTTSLWYLLKQHPDIYMSEVKEPRFFSRSDYKKHLTWYKSLFEHVKNEKIVGEASVDYCETHLFKDTPKNIYKFNPTAKLVYVVRDPIDRINSCWRQALSSGHWYRYYYHTGLMPLSFGKAIFEYPHLLKTTMYYQNLSEFLKYFDENQIKILFYEDFKRNGQESVQSIFEFLGIDTGFVPNGIDKPKNVGATKKMAHPSLKKIANILSRFPGFTSVNNFNRGISMIAKYYPKTKQIEPQWSFETKQKFLSYVKDDSTKILDYANKSHDIWTLNI